MEKKVPERRLARDGLRDYSCADTATPLANLWQRPEMSATPPIECDIVMESSSDVLLTVMLPVVPRIGEELDLDLGGGGRAAEGVYVVRAVRYHLRPRRFTRSGDLFGVRLLVAPVS
jgi:hypothetical protein